MEYKDLVDVCKDAMDSAITSTTSRDPTSPIRFSIPKINRTRMSPKSFLHTDNPAAFENGGSKPPQRPSQGHAPADPTQKLESSGPSRLHHQSSVTSTPNPADGLPLFIPLPHEQRSRYRHGDLRLASNASSLSHENPARHPRCRRNKQEKTTAIKKLTSIPRGKGRRENDTKGPPGVTITTLSLLDSSQGALEDLTTSTKTLTLERESRRDESPMSPLVIRGRFYEDRIVG